MNLFNKQKNAALATALMFCGVSATGESVNVSQALKNVRAQRQDARTIASDDIPALITIMGEPMPHASLVEGVIQPPHPGEPPLR